MKVIHIINNLGSGGAEKMLGELTLIMNQMEDITADILLLTDEGNVFYDGLRDKGIKIDTLKMRRLYNPLNIFEIRKYIVKGNYDIVHAHIYPTQLWVALSRVFISKKKVKFITTEHNTNNRRRGKAFFRLLDRYMYTKYDEIISISKKTRDNLLEWIDSNNKQIDKHRVIENGIDLDKITQAIPYNKCEISDKITGKSKLVCMVARFAQSKDQPTLIKAISKLPADVHLILIGEGPLKDKNIELAKELGILDKVHFLGFRKDVPRILKTVDIVVLSSHWEGFGLVAVEGMAAGKPLIASDVPGLREVVNGAGELFAVGDYNELSETINKLLKDDNYYKLCAKKCARRALSFSIHKTAVEYQKRYQIQAKGSDNQGGQL